MSGLHHVRLLAPAALACFRVWCRPGAKRLVDTTPYMVCAAKPREPRRDGEDVEHQTYSKFLCYKIERELCCLEFSGHYFPETKGLLECRTSDHAVKYWAIEGRFELQGG